MQAIILAGGKGTRLRPLTESVPKPMIPIDGKPFVVYQIDHLKKFGVDEVILSVGYLAEQFEEYFSTNPLSGLNVIIVKEDSPMGTGGGIKECESFLDDEFFAMNGDSIFDIDFSRLRKAHHDKGALVTIALKKLDVLTEDLKEKGIVKIDKNGRITSFSEKPRTLDKESMFMSSGFYMFSKEALSMIPKGKKFSLEEDLFPELIKKKRVYSVSYDDYFIDIGRHETLNELKRSIHEIRKTGN